MRVNWPLVGDIALAVALAVIGVIGTANNDQWAMVSGRPMDATGVTLAGVAGMTLVGRRRWPLGTLAVTSALCAAYLLLGYAYGPIMVPFAVAVYTTARYRALPVAAPAALAALALVLSHHLLTSNATLSGLLGLIPGSAWAVVPFAVGVAVRVSREAAARAREEVIRQRVDDERLRVAQEVHDVVGHALAAIKMQADVALHVLAKKPQQAETALHAISRTSGEALEELRATLALIRRVGADSTRSPTPGLARLAELRRGLEGAGVRVRLETVGAARTLPAAVDVAGYRVVQEALTNVLRHSGSRDASVVIRYEPDALAITVSNPVTGAPRPGNGLGIPGMRERVRAVGGRFSAGPTADGRFEVHAYLPTGGTA